MIALASLLIFCLCLAFYDTVYCRVGSSTYSWSPTPAQYSYPYTAIATSVSGDGVAAAGKNGGIYLSTDSGSTWIFVDSPFGVNFWDKLEMSQSGRYLVAIGATPSSVSTDVYTSSDYGNSWVLRNLPSSYFTSVSISSTGQYMVVGSKQFDDISNGGLYRSDDFGETWSSVDNVPSANTYWVSVGTALEGKHMVASAYNCTSGKRQAPSNTYVSEDYGLTWVPSAVQLIAPGDGARAIYGDLALSEAGNFSFIVVQEVFLYLSLDGGYNWTVATVNDAPWRQLACSQSGQYVVASADDGIFLSDQYGVTWNKQTLPAYNPVFLPVAMAGAGFPAYVAQSYQGSVFKGTETGLTEEYMEIFLSLVQDENLFENEAENAVQAVQLVTARELAISEGYLSVISSSPTGTDDADGVTVSSDASASSTSASATSSLSSSSSSSSSSNITVLWKLNVSIPLEATSYSTFSEMYDHFTSALTDSVTSGAYTQHLQQTSKNMKSNSTKSAVATTVSYSAGPTSSSECSSDGDFSALNIALITLTTFFVVLSFSIAFAWFSFHQQRNRENNSLLKGAATSSDGGATAAATGSISSGGLEMDHRA